jgi:hypothetical protein
MTADMHVGYSTDADADSGEKIPDRRRKGVGR